MHYRSLIGAVAVAAVLALAAGRAWAFDDALLIETRTIKGSRTFDSGGMPLHKAGQTIVKEGIYSDMANSAILHDDITTFDHALTRPSTVTKNYRRAAQPNWIEFLCDEDNHWLTLGKESDFIGADGYLLPGRKDQPPPDLKYVREPPK